MNFNNNSIYIMKKFFTLIMVVVMTALSFSCTKDNNAPKIVSQSDATISVPVEGGSFEILYKVENPVQGAKVTAECKDSWITDLTVSETDSKVTFRAGINTEAAARETVIKVIYEYSGKSVSFETKVSQSASNDQSPIIAPEEKEVLVFCDGGTYEVKYEIANPVDGATISAEITDNPGWITDLDAATEGVVKFNVAKNSSKKEREAELVIKYTYTDGEKTASVKIKQEGDENGNDYDIDLVAKVFDGTYYGHKFSATTANYWTVLSDNGYTSSGYVKPSSTYFRLDIFASDPADPDNITLAEGTYTYDASSSHTNNTISSFARYIYTDADGGAWEEKFTEATLVVKREGNDYHFELTGITENDMKFHVVYTGPQKYEDKSASQGPSDQSTITDDYAANFEGASAYGDFYGDALGNGTGYWAFELQPKGGLGDGLGLKLYSSETTFGDFPTGTYTVSDSGTANTASKGSISGKNLSGSCLYILQLQNQITGFALLNEGQIEISKTGSTYTITLDVKDELGHKVTGTWTGNISLKNVSGN